jgi:hypothetical protein
LNLQIIFRCDCYGSSQVILTYVKEIVMAMKVTGDQYRDLDGQLFEIKRQLRQSGGYPFDIHQLKLFLQRAIEGKFLDDQIWRQENDVIYFEVTSEGTTGLEWIERLGMKGFKFTNMASSLLHSEHFYPTNGITYQVAIFPARFFPKSKRITHSIREEAYRRKFANPQAEIACLIGEKLSCEALDVMGFSGIAVFHDPIQDLEGVPSLLSIYGRYASHWVGTCVGRPDTVWSSDCGFAFALPQPHS